MTASAAHAVQPLLAVEDLQVRFELRGRTVHAVNGVDLQVQPGRTLAIIGESGSGKTVTSRAIMGLLTSAAVVDGSIRLGGRELVGLSEKALRAVRGCDVAMVFQDPARSLNPTMRIGTQITEAMRVHLDLTRRQARVRAVELLDMVRVPAPERRFDEYPHELSGGMRQRVMIAIAIACGPKLLIADEATTALDVTTQAQVMDLLMDLQDELDMGLILISHDMGLAANYADDVTVMYAGQVIERGSVQEVFGHVRMPYTRLLLEAVPRPDRPPHTPFPTVRSRPPDLSAMPAACAFAPRCPRVQTGCTVDSPRLEQHEKEHWWACFHPESGQERIR